MQVLNRIYITTYLNIKQRYLDADSEKGGISLEAAIIGGILLAIAVAVAAKLGALQDDAEQKIPDSL